MEKYLIVRAIENIVLYIIVAVLFWFTRSPWVFLFLLFVNIDRRANKASTPTAGTHSDKSELSDLPGDTVKLGGRSTSGG
jgi:hypothetical protein